MTENGRRPDSASGTGQRRSGRIQREIPIILIGSDAEGLVFSEETKTVMISRFGAGIVSLHKLTAEQELALRIAGTNREAEVRVVGEIAKQGSVHTYGLAFVDETANFWQVEFPPPPSWQVERPAVFTMECVGCGDAVEVMNGDFEFDVCAIHGGLARFCRECGLLTVWRRVANGAADRRRAKVAKRPAVKEPDVVVSLQDWVEPLREMKAVALAEPVDRRGRTRAKVSFFACVRTAVFGEEVVPCIDMSKGGVSFRGKHAYEKDMRLEIAVPYAADVREAPAIFVKGRIAHVRAEGAAWKCGVEFLR